MSCILFSPVSDRDPCSADRTFRNVYRDGALLHIVRHYQPHKVYLFLTERFQKFEAKDERYTKMLKHVAPEIEIQLLYCPKEIQNVALFDQFDAPFAEYLRTIHQENPTDQLLVNVSSGTPQMQASLYLLVATLTFPVKAVQVLSPNRESNAERDFYDPTLAECSLGEDAVVTAQTPEGKTVSFTENRSRDVSCKNAVRAIQAQNISQLVDGDDYIAAQEIYKSSKEHFTDRLEKLLRIGYAHLNLNEQEAQRLEDEGFPWRAYYEPAVKNLPDFALRCYDYLLYLDSLVRRKALNDYARALSPALTTIMRMRLEQAGCSIMPFCETDANGVIKLKNYRIRRKDRGFMQYLNNQYGGSFRDGPLSAIQMLHYMGYLKQNTGLDLDTEEFKKLRQAEETVRNGAAHEMKGVTEDQIEDSTRSSAADILTQMKTQYEKAIHAAAPLQWDSLLQLKVQIKKELSVLPD